MTYIYLSIFIGTILWTFATKRDIFSPVRVYILAYSGMLSINSLKLSGLQTDWSPTTHYFFWGATAMFIAGGVLISLVDRIVNPEDPIDLAFVKKSLSENAQSIDWRWFYWTWIGVVLVFHLAFAYGTYKAGTIPILSENPDRARIDFLSNFFTGIGWFFGPLSLMLSIEMIFFSKIQGLKRISIYVLSIITLLVYMTIVTRLDLFRFGLFAIILYHYGKKNISLFTTSLFAIAGVLVFSVAFLFRVKSDAIGTLNQMLEVNMPKGLEWTSGIYSYVVCNFWNLDYAFREFVDGINHYPQSWGYELFRPFFFAFRLERLMHTTYGFDGIFNDSITKVTGLNTSIYMWHFYKDFGAFGALFLPFFFSILLALFYNNTLRFATLFRISLLGIFAGMILFSFTAVLWSFWFTYLNIAILIIAHRKIGLSSPTGNFNAYPLRP